MDRTSHQQQALRDAYRRALKRGGTAEACWAAARAAGDAAPATAKASDHTAPATWRKPLCDDEVPTPDKFGPSDTAWHEAAHAVVAIAQGTKVDHIALRRDGGGYCQAETFDDLRRRGLTAAQAARRRAIIALAGGLASPETHASPSDESNARNAIASAGGGGEMWLECRQQASNLVTRHRKAIRDVALALDRRTRLSGDQVRRLMKGLPLQPE